MIAKAPDCRTAPRDFVYEVNGCDGQGLTLGKALTLKVGQVPERACLCKFSTIGNWLVVPWL